MPCLITTEPIPLVNENSDDNRHQTYMGQKILRKHAYMCNLKKSKVLTRMLTFLPLEVFLYFFHGQ